MVRIENRGSGLKPLKDTSEEQDRRLAFPPKQDDQNGQKRERRGCHKAICCEKTGRREDGAPPPHGRATADRPTLASPSR